MSEASRRVGLIGLGAMGLNVARSLMRRDFVVHGCDLRRSALAALTEAGGVACATPADVAAACDVIVVLVVDDVQTEGALFGADGAASRLRPGAVVISSATMNPASVQRLGERLAEIGVGLLDSPVTGGVVGAANATLTLLTAGPDWVYAKCQDVLDAMSGKVYRFGAEVGLGSKVKVINQLLVGVQIAAAAEAMALGLREGVDPDLLYEALRSGAGNSWAFTDRVPRILSGRYEAITALDIFVKDLGLVLEAAKATRFPTPLAATAYQMFATAAAAGHGREDDIAVIKTFPGVTLPGPREVD